MKSATSCFKIPMSVVKEDLRRFKAVPILALLGYIIFTIVPILLNYRWYEDETYVNNLYSVVNNLVENHGLALANSIWLPIAAGIMVFSYMQKKGSSVASHALPFTRGQFFRGHVLSGTIMTFVPVILCGIILLIISKPIYMTGNGDVFTTAEMASSLGLSKSAIDGADNLFSASVILRWAGENLVQVFYIFAVTVFAGMVTGTTIHHFIAACGFNAIAPLMAFLTGVYECKYYFGMTDNWEIVEVDRFSPTLYLACNGKMSMKAALVFILISIVILAASLCLYRLRKLERVSEGVVFKPMGMIITLLFGFLAMSATNLIFTELFNENSVGFEIISYVVGALIGIVIARMIITKSLKIFDKEFVKSIVIYAVLAGIFFAILGFDLFGVEKKVPENNQFDSVEVQNFVIGNDTALADCQFSDDESKTVVRALHEDIISHKDELKGCEDDDTEGTYVYIRYYKEKGKNSDNQKTIVSRQYFIPSTYLFESDAYKKLLGTDELKKMLAKHYDELYKNRKSAYVYASGIPGADSVQEKLDEAQVGEFLKVYSAEMESYTAEEMLNRMIENEIVNLEISGVSQDYSEEKNAEYIVYDDVYSMTVSVKGSDIESIKWLRENGILGDMENKGIEACEYAVVSPLSSVSDSVADLPSYVYESIDAQHNDENIFIEDKETMLKAYRMMKEELPSMKTAKQMKNSDEYYFISFKENPEDEYDDDDYVSYKVGFISKEDLAALKQGLS